MIFIIAHIYGIDNFKWTYQQTYSECVCVCCVIFINFAIIGECGAENEKNCADDMGDGRLRQ